ncbi:MAG: hypothetical protein VX392_00520, partial [Verrucomicrobiota bacterium]|nr:hypothetical protein [Verrucomicrobiota bacterium]
MVFSKFFDKFPRLVLLGAAKIGCVGGAIQSENESKIVVAKRKVGKKNEKTAKKVVKKMPNKKAPSKKAAPTTASAKKAPVVKAPAKKKTKRRSNQQVGAATTAAILGLPSSPATRAAQKRKEAKLENGGKWAKQKKLLINLRDRLTDQRNGLAKESAKEMESYG